MHYSELKLLLLKYRQNRCSSDELRRLQIYFSDTKNESGIKESLITSLEDFTPDKNEATAADFTNLFDTISSKISEEDVSLVDQNLWQGRQIFTFLKIAAAIIAVFLLGGISAHILFNEKAPKDQITYNEIRAPYGARSLIVLPDGSSVWLNAGSKLRYMNVFNKENRDVYLEGEAYFKVAANKAIPFHVRAGDLSIEAIGTEFNVMSYLDEGIIETTLVEGKISIRNNTQKRSADPVYLEPHQKAVYLKDINLISVEDLKEAGKTKMDAPNSKKGTIYIDKEVDPLPIIAWKDNKLILKGEELSSLLIKLERKYDVQFIYESENIKKFRFTGTLGDETLTQVLDFIKLSAPIEYKLEGKTVTLSENKKMMEKFSTHLKKK